MISKLFAITLDLIIHEVNEDLIIIKEIFKFYGESIIENFHKQQKKRVLRKKMKKTINYKQWKSLALSFDKLPDIKFYKENIFSNLYDYNYIQKLRNDLLLAKNSSNPYILIQLLRSHSFRNIAGYLNPELYNYIAELSDAELPFHDKLEFFSESRHAFGRTALCLSGGAFMGLYHFGVIKALYEEDLLPKIVTGSSAGSIVASFLCTRSYEEIPNNKPIIFISPIQKKISASEKFFKIFKPKYLDFSAFKEIDHKHNLNIFDILLNFMKEGYLKDRKSLQQFTRDNIGDFTFQEAFDKTGWILNITVTGIGDHESYRLLNYLTAPNVLIWSAAVASCGIPYVYGPVELYCKNENNQIVEFLSGRKFVDGSIGADLPMQKISEMFNVNCFVVSQTNPYYIPFQDYSGIYKYKRMKQIYLKFFEKIKILILSEIKHRICQLKEIGILPNFVSFYTNLFTQSYQGSVTISPMPQAEDYWNIMQNPSEKEIARCSVLGQKYCWEKISYISSLYSVEKAIEYCYKHVKAKQNNLKANIYYKKKYKRIDSLTFPTEIRTILPDDIADMGQKINAID